MTADHPNNVNRGGMCAYIKKYLPVHNLIHSYISEYLNLEVTTTNKKGYFIALYRFPSQTPNEFNSFINNLENLLINIAKRDPH